MGKKKSRSRAPVVDGVEKASETPAAQASGTGGEAADGQTVDPPTGLRAKWPQIRGVLVALHVLAVFMLAFPAPAGVMQRSAWRDPSVQAEFRIWTDRANALGIGVSQQEFEDFIYDLAIGFMDVRNAAIAPARPYGDYLGVRQDWRMFSAPHRFPTRLHIEIEENGAWRTLYVERSDEFTWRRAFFEHHRVRRLLFLHGWSQFRRRYEGFARYIAGEAAVEFPDATRVRLSHFKYRSPTAKEAGEGKWDIDGKFINRRVIDLDRVREDALKGAHDDAAPDATRESPATNTMPAPPPANPVPLDQSVAPAAPSTTGGAP